MDIHNTIITRENVIEFLNHPGSNGQLAVPVVQELLNTVESKDITKKVEKKGKK